MNVFLLSLRLAVICGVYEDVMMVLARVAVASLLRNQIKFKCPSLQLTRGTCRKLD